MVHLDPWTGVISGTPYSHDESRKSRDQGNQECCMTSNVEAVPEPVDRGRVANIKVFEFDVFLPNDEVLAQLDTAARTVENTESLLVSD